MMKSKRRTEIKPSPTVVPADRVHELSIGVIGMGDELSYTWHHGYETLKIKRAEGGGYEYQGAYHPEGICEGTGICKWCGRTLFE